VADEVKATYGGMMIAIPEKPWRGFESQPDKGMPRGKEVDRHASTARVPQGDENT
jgi:hypothetical protein